VIDREGVVAAWIGVEGARSFGQATVQIGGSGWCLGTEPSWRRMRQAPLSAVS
jgi:hypothetical protein